jgi:hypothetical protein
MKIARISAPIVLSLLAACGSKTSSNGPGQDPGLAGDGDPAQQAPDTNPSGVAYPTDHVGTNSRAGSVAGDRIRNFKFMGYPNGDSSKGLEPVSLASYFDPTGSKYVLIHIQASGTWCPHCRNEISAVDTIKSSLDQIKVVWLVSLAEGPYVGQPSTQADLDSWISEFKSPYTHLLDPGNRNLGPFYNDAALPWNANIRAKTMEIVTAGVGAIEDGPGILKDLNDTIASLDKLDKPGSTSYPSQ